MPQIDVASITLPGFQYSTGSAAITLRFYVNTAFTRSQDGATIQPGSPQGGRWYSEYTCTLVGSDLTIPMVHLDSTTDAEEPSKPARYSAYFFAGNRYLAPYAGFESFRVLGLYATDPATWSQIRADNTSGQASFFGDTQRFTDQQIIRLIDAAIAAGSGVTSIGGLTGPAISLVDDTNVTITPSGSTLTLGWTGSLAVARGGSGSTTAAGARANLSAAKLGANSDITSLSGLTTPLSAAQGGLGFASYTAGDILYASGATAISKLGIGSAGQILAVAAGVPAWTSTPSLAATTVASLTNSSLTSGRVTFAGAAGLLSDSSTFLRNSSTGNISIGTTLASEKVTLPLSGYVGGVNNAGAAVTKLIGATYNSVDAKDAVSIGTSAQRITFDAPVVSAVLNPPSWTDITTAGSYGKQFYAGAVTPVGAAYSLFASWDASYGSGSANYDVLNVTGATLSARVTTGLKVQMDGQANGGSVLGANVIVGCNWTGAGGVNATALELNPVVLTTGTTNAAGGLYVANTGRTGTTRLGAFGYYIRTAITAGGPESGSLYGWEIASPSQPAILSATDAATLSTTSAVIAAHGPIAPTYGIDFADVDAAAAAILLHNNNSIRANTSGLASVNLMNLTGADYLEVGDGLNAGMGGVLIRDGSSEAMRFVRSGTQDIAGNIGFYQTSPSAQVHITGIPKRTFVTGSGDTVAVTNGSNAMTGTGTTFLTDIAPGSSVIFGSQPGTTYIVFSVTSNTAAVLTTNYSGSTSIATSAKSDYRTFLIEGASGEDWIEVSNRHTVNIFGDSTFADERGMLTLRARANNNQKLAFGVNSSASTPYAYITSIQSGTAWRPLILQGGAGSSNAGGVVIGTSVVSTAGAMLKVEGGRTDPAGNQVGSEFNDLSTNSSGTGYDKILAQYLGSGAWNGTVKAGYFWPTGGSNTTTGDRTNIPLYAVGGKSWFGPVAALVSLPVVPTSPTATVDVYGYPTESATIGADTVQTFASTTITGTGTTWNTAGAADRLRPGDAVQFGSDTRVYQIATVVNDGSATLSDSYAGTPSGATEMWRDPYLLKLTNAYGTERFHVESNGAVVLGGTSTQGSQSKTLTESSATAFVTIFVPSGTWAGGYVEYTIVADDGTDFQSRSGILPFAIVNKAGTETATIGTVTTATEVVAVSTGTLTNTFAADTSPTNGVSITANAASSLTQTTLKIFFYVRVTSSGSLTVSPL